MLSWPAIDCVFLDMDGTLLDLNFDNHFWQEHVPLRYAERLGGDVQRAKDELFPRFRRVEGTMDWYCIDYWSRELDLDIALLKQEVAHLIAVHPHVSEFLHALRNKGKRIVLVTNAHHKSLTLKMERTQLRGHFDRVVCAHDLGRPKEDPGFWAELALHEPFIPQRTLLIDDSLPVLRSAQGHGIAHLCAIRQPDTCGPLRDISEFPAIAGFQEIMPD